MPDELLEKLANYYTSEYVKLNRPEIASIPFWRWLQRLGWKVMK
ncbi:hypothetical protein [Tepidibacillus fermentans]|uniref:Uncharacterized protein n=1 Tax=Tepidibacillus fermentans TaxID=1281767 RepID=A0A4R3KCK1_9BACI|nr:hypothetical protein [Tepidibacillus fermentans]TCS80361.1 hypothetical protein EDD72_11728 [Tepidibacillus fermentans]